MPITQSELDEVALSRAEYEAIADRLGRDPSDLELGLFGSLWSEHCGYKHSKPLLRTLPGESERLLVSLGTENAGVVDIGDGLAIAMKIESHNHPSAIEPHEGAATGVGGIVRDIFAMGARPIALLNSLRFGKPDTARNRYLLSGVVGGISFYGNCLGIPNVGGEVVFASCYDGNPLVNAMCVGLVEDGRIMSARAEEPGDVLLLVGSDTGRDGIHGASGLASRTFEEQNELRSAVQVGNPFLEKVLIEACMEVIQLDSVVGLQDCGAAGITSGAIEMAERSDMGLRLDVAEVPRREEGMTPYEVMLSESQERMLLAVKPGREHEVQAIFSKWDLHATAIGEFFEGDSVVIQDGEDVLSETRIKVLTDPPEYEFDPPKPGWIADLQNTDLSSTPPPSESPADLLLKLLASPNIASKLPVFRQYDHQVQTNTVIAPGGDAAVLRLKGSQRGIALSTDGNGRICYLDPYIGGQIAVAEACRNVSATGGLPVAITDCLNFGSPETEDGQYQLVQAVAGIKSACEAFDIPVISGNVSLYNEAPGGAIYPTPVIGAMGLLDDVTKHAAAGFAGEGDAVYLLGAAGLTGDSSSLAGSEFQDLVMGVVTGQPSIDLDIEVRVQQACRDGIVAGLVRSAHDVSDGGLAVALVESAVIGGMGVRVDAIASGRWDAVLFGEAQSRIVVTVSSDHAQEFESVATKAGAPVFRLGTTGGDRIVISDLLDVSLSEASDSWQNGFEAATRG
ncbi:MAG: phosphoribosylformylglycinamidine synthase subunit PurL [Chloroflexi bacterium]|nr:phosphoribosylformylglycinamidine synthase subunit PurL [Chloroflexota bacterium]MBT5319018.1 phosphoribosylformylglycinamidine synthase subunit PurL [Chloroflexota bacterium]